MKCKDCLHYGFYQMITQGAYGYVGVIPCQNCQYYLTPQDNFEPNIKEPKILRDKHGDTLGE